MPFMDPNKAKIVDNDDPVFKYAFYSVKSDRPKQTPLFKTYRDVVTHARNSGEPVEDLTNPKYR